ncbi:MAG: hypothetical protein PHC84_00020 [Clostridia bacterium]|nr:hypothetical protein [Clostridia bacterium]
MKKKFIKVLTVFATALIVVSMAFVLLACDDGADGGAHKSAVVLIEAPSV